MDAGAEIIEQMVEYMQTVLEKPHPAFGGLPICPFARRARLEKTILFRVHRFYPDADLFAGSALAQLFEDFQDFSDREHYEAMLIIHPDRKAMTLAELHEFVDQVNEAIAPQNLLAFGGHPEESFNIQGVYTRREPYINFTIQTCAKIKTASDLLKKTAYYHNWSPEQLMQVGFPRE
jgi:hypothetical protein